jgi:AAA domain
MYWISSIGSVIYVVKPPLAKVCCCEPWKGVVGLTLMSGASSYAGYSKPSEPFIRDIHDWYGSKLWVFDAIGNTKVDRIFEVFRYARRRYDVRLFVIDNLAKCGIDEDDYKSQKAFVDRLTDFAKDHDTHVILVAHMRKGQDENIPAGQYQQRWRLRPPFFDQRMSESGRKLPFSDWLIRAATKRGSYLPVRGKANALTHRKITRPKDCLPCEANPPGFRHFYITCRP